MKNDIVIRFQANSINELLSRIEELEEVLKLTKELDDLDRNIVNKNGIPICTAVVVKNDECKMKGEE